MALTTIERFAYKTQRNLLECARAIKIGVLGGIIGDSRWDTGRLRGGYKTSSYPIQTDEVRLDQSGALARKEMVDAVTGDGVEYMTNNTPYVGKWEEVDANIPRNFAKVEAIVRAFIQRMPK